VRLPEPVNPVVVLAERPFIEPLVGLVAAEWWCVVLISHRASRIFTGTREHFVEVGGVLDDVHGRHSQGGWSQARYQRGIAMETDEHVRRTCAILLERLQRRAFAQLLVAGPAELHHRVEHELDPQLRQLLVGCLEIDVERASSAEVQERARPLIEAEEQQREQQALGQLKEGLAPGGHGAVGLDEVLELLSEGRVGTLLVAHGYAAQGFACPGCGRLWLGGSACAVDGAEPQQREDIVESAIELALERSAAVLIVRHEVERFAAHGPIAALVRY
jgi:peptide chain release factor subunit 1